ncbi:MAG: L-histidine N(alpha)-methyltransferase [Acidimicrobiia bacterium]|nr:L-histidine N(alpha)-methyltransferase [Acidimicrobiia bacterium]
MRIDVHIGPDEMLYALRTDVRTGLGASPKSLPPKWFYDDTGSRLFDEITRLDEYYPTRTERSILAASADDIVAVAGADTLVELGSGTGEKTRLILDAMRRAGRLTRVCPFDVSEGVLHASATALEEEYPGVDVHAVVGDFEHHLDLLPCEGRRMIVFLGSTIGNFPPKARAAFFGEVAAGLDAGESLLLGTDLVKPTGRLVAAYDDARGVTAAFNKNVLAVINRELGADFDLAAFTHVALWNDTEAWIEMRLRSTRDQTVSVPDLGLTVGFVAGEELLTETSAKFTQDGVVAELEGAGLDLRGWWTDPNRDFALSLWSPG